MGSIRVAGKTGSLAEQGPFRDYSWFVGFAPVENPQVAVATFVMNNAQWRVRADHPGYEKRKDGRDYGADVKRLLGK